MRPLVARGFHLYEGEEKWFAKGVTYGPFAPNGRGEPFPELAQVRADLAAIAEMGANAVRVYVVPSEAFAEVAAQNGLRLLVDIPWPKHLDVYSDKERQEMCRDMVRQGIAQVKNWPNVAGVLLGNEIPSDLVRWSGTNTVERFLRTLCEEARQAAPHLLLGYANYPGTEFLQPRSFDFIGFNIYLHDSVQLREYLTRLRHMYPETPLVLTETGLDTQSNNEEEQAKYLRESLGIAYLTGLSGAYVFSWTDEWHTGGYDIMEWSFGLVDRERKKKIAYNAVADIFEEAPHCRKLAAPPKVSVVIATNNGGETLRQCLRSLKDLNYPDYETIVVDDGSTDGTSQILKEFPEVEAIVQPNLGLSAARNAGIGIAKGELVAFLDSDCFADPDWLYHLVEGLGMGNFVGIGGPNLTPPANNHVQQSIAQSPGHATHVLFENGDAEHLPGCNMAFMRSALIEVNGFDPDFRKAGDDVDLTWRLHDLGRQIGFSTAAFVWHHRRPTVRRYIKQQIGYGEAEALLQNKHPNRFNEKGQSIWKGRIYSGAGASGALAKQHIQFGVFGSAGYQCIYPASESPLFFFFTSLEWWILSLGLILAGVFAFPALVLGAVGISLPLALGAAQAYSRCSNSGSLSFRHFPLVWFLWVVQPLVREASRYWFRRRAVKPSKEFDQELDQIDPRWKIEFWPKGILVYWSEWGKDRLSLLRELGRVFSKRGWIYQPNTPWEPWDFQIFVTNLYKLRLTSADEDHGGAKRLVRFRFQLSPTPLQTAFILGGLLLCVSVAFQNTVWARWIFIAWLILHWLFYRKGCRGRTLVQSVVDEVARREGLQPMESFAPVEDSELSRIAEVKPAASQPD